LRKEGVIIEEGAPFFSDQTPQNSYYRLAYSSIKSSKIEKGLERIAGAISKAS